MKLRKEHLTSKAVNYNKFIKIIALVVLTLVCILTWINTSHAGGPWNDQYCDIEVTKIKVVDSEGNLIKTQTEEKMVCNDGAKDFLHGMGIAKNCNIFTWDLRLNGTIVPQRTIACERLDGGYEIVPGYHNIN